MSYSIPKNETRDEKRARIRRETTVIHVEATEEARKFRAAKDAQYLREGRLHARSLKNK